MLAEEGVVYGQSPKNKIAVDYANNKVYVSALTVDYRGLGVDNFVSVLISSNLIKKAQQFVGEMAYVILIHDWST